MHTPYVARSVEKVHGRIDAIDRGGINSGNFSQAVRRGNTIYVGGTLAIDQARQVVVDETLEAAIRKAYENLIAILTAADASVDDVVMLSALLTDLDDLETLNAVQAEFFSDPHPPRSTFKVAGLPHGPIELTAVAVLD